MSGLKIITAPALEPIDVSTMKNFLRVDHDQDDDLIAMLITAARASCEKFSGRSFVSQGLRYYTDFSTFLPMRLRQNQIVFSLPHPPLIAVDSIVISQPGQEDKTLASDAFSVVADNEPSLISFDASYLSCFWGAGSFLTVDYRAGYGASVNDVPEDLRLAVMQTVASFYQNRGDVSAELPVQAVSLLAPYKMITVEGL